MRTTKPGKSPAKVECRFELEQRQNDVSGESLHDIMTLCRDFLSASLKETKTKTKNPKFRLRTTNIESNRILINYLQKYPLFSSKYLDFQD